jgi:hypothetical protein
VLILLSFTHQASRPLQTFSRHSAWASSVNLFSLHKNLAHVDGWQKDDGMLINKYFHYLYLLISCALISFRTEGFQGNPCTYWSLPTKFDADMVKVIDDTNSCFGTCYHIDRAIHRSAAFNRGLLCCCVHFTWYNG